MKIFLKVLSCIGAIVLLLLSMVFLFVEFRALFAGDLVLAQNVGSAVTAAISRILVFLLFGFFAVFAILNAIKPRNSVWFISLGFVSVVAAATTFRFYDWYFALGLILSAGIAVLAGLDNAVRRR